MSDLERLESLLPKLSHFSPSVRLRSGKNLLFKMSNGLLAEVLESPLCAKLLSDGIVGSLSTIMANEGAWKDVTNEDSSLLKTMCLLLQHMTKLKGRSMQNTYKDLSKATSLLQKFASQFVKDGEEKALVEEVSTLTFSDDTEAAVHVMDL